MSAANAFISQAASTVKLNNAKYWKSEKNELGDNTTMELNLLQDTHTHQRNIATHNKQPYMFERFPITKMIQN